LSNLHKIGKYVKGIGEKSGKLLTNIEGNQNFRIQSVIDTASTLGMPLKLGNYMKTGRNFRNVEPSRNISLQYS